MSHRNARLTVHGRRLIVERVLIQGRPRSHVAKEMGVSRQCVSRWIARYQTEGEPGLQERSSRPRNPASRTCPEVEQRVLAVREHERRGQDWIGPELGVPARTVSRILRRHRVPYLRELDPMTGAVIRSSKATAVRYERDRPGELVHMDVKKIGRIPDGGGWRAHGRAARDPDRTHKTGFDYVHSLVDDHSRLAYSEVLSDEKGATCAGFLARAADYFAAHGITRIERVMTDNAWAYKWSLRDVVAQLGARQVFIKPHCPWQNGKVERLKCATRRLVVSPAQPGGTRREVPGSDGLPNVERLMGTRACQETSGRVQMSETARWETRVIWRKLDCLNPNLQEMKVHIHRKDIWNRCQPCDARLK